MLLFATEFPVRHANTIQEFASAVRTWILGSPHTQLRENDVAELAGPIEKNDERIDTLTLDSVSESIAGVVYRKREDDLEWITSIVFNRSGADAWVGVRVERQSKRLASNLPQAKKPVVVRTLLDKLGGASDGMLRVGDEPHKLGDVDVESAAALISGEGRCYLPVVYVSAGFHGDHNVDFNRLARELSGMAHVVVEPNRNFSRRLQIEVDSENVYGGTVGVYWPHAAGRRSFFAGQGLESPKEVRRAVFEEVCKALANRRALERCTWSYVKEATSRQRLAELRASGSRELEKYVETFDNELDAKKQQIKDAEREIVRLRNELRSRKERREFYSGGLLRGGRERDFYPGELYCIVRAALEDAKRRVRRGSRREHVLSDILAANSLDKDGSKVRRTRLKEILQEKRGIDPQTKKNIEDLGFAITDGGKHYKLVFQGDARYTFSLPKSSSDHRSGKNAAADIGGLLF